MHSFARRRSQRCFGPGEGIALSQYDMAEVQMAFGAIAPIVAEKEMNSVPLTRREREDLCHAWRVVGYLLGIQDEYNICNDLDEMTALVDEWLQWVPRRLQTARKETLELQAAAIAGSGLYSGFGCALFFGARARHELTRTQRRVLLGAAARELRQFRV